MRRQQGRLTEPAAGLNVPAAPPGRLWGEEPTLLPFFVLVFTGLLSYDRFFPPRRLVSVLPRFCRGAAEQGRSGSNLTGKATFGESRSPTGRSSSFPMSPRGIPDRPVPLRSSTGSSIRPRARRESFRETTWSRSRLTRSGLSPAKTKRSRGLRRSRWLWAIRCQPSWLRRHSISTFRNRKREGLFVFRLRDRPAARGRALTRRSIRDAGECEFEPALSVDMMWK